MHGHVARVVLKLANVRHIG